MGERTATGRAIFQYDLSPTVVLQLAAGPASQVRGVTTQDRPLLWVQHDVVDNRPVVDREWEVVLVPTGMVVPSEWSYVGMLQAVSLERGEGDEPVPKFWTWHAFYREVVVEVPADVSELL